MQALPVRGVIAANQQAGIARVESGADRASELRAFSGSESTARRRQRNLNSLAWGVLVIASLLSLWAGATAWQQAREHARAQFDARADAVATAVATHMNAYEDTVRAAAAVLEGREDIGQDDFLVFVEKLKVPTRHAGLHGLGFARRVRLEERDAYVTAQRARYGDAFAIHPAGDRAEYVVIDLLYPAAPGMRPLLGKDVMAEAARRSAIESARDSGELASAPLVALGDATRGSTGLAGSCCMRRSMPIRSARAMAWRHGDACCAASLPQASAGSA